MHWDLRAVGTGFYDSAPFRFHYEAMVRRPPEQLFEAIAADPAGWGDWFPGFDHSGHWLTPGPHGVDSRRAVRMAGVRYEETILAYDSPHRFAFRLDRASAPLAYALGEDYRITEHPEGSTLEWTFAIDPRPLTRPAAGLFDPVLGRLFRRVASNLENRLGR
jgi:uncharacterized protein YndB with AHSA1/START domain